MIKGSTTGYVTTITSRNLQALHFHKGHGRHVTLI